MKIAFVILAYKNPEQISALVKSLTHQDHYFFIHIDKTKPVLVDVFDGVVVFRNEAVIENNKENILKLS